MEKVGGARSYSQLGATWLRPTLRAPPQSSGYCPSKSDSTGRQRESGMDRQGDTTATGGWGTTQREERKYSGVLTFAVGAKEGPKKVPFGGGYAAAKHLPCPETVQVRGSSYDPKVGRKRILDVVSGSCTRLPPSKHASRCTEISGNSVERSDVRLHGSSIWSGNVALGVHQTYKGTSHFLPAKWGQNVGIPRRSIFHSTYKGASVGAEGVRTVYNAEAGSGDRREQKQVGARSEVGGSGYDCRNIGKCDCKGYPSCSSEDPKHGRKNASSGTPGCVAHPSSVVQTRGKNAGGFNGCRPMQAYYQGDVQGSRGSSSAGRMGLPGDSDRQTTEGFAMVEGEPESVEWKRSTATWICELLIHGRVPHRIRSAAGWLWNSVLRKLEPVGKQLPHKCVGGVSSKESPYYFSGLPDREADSIAHRLQGSNGNHLEVAFSEPNCRKDCGGNLGMDNREPRGIAQARVDSVRGEYRRRSIKNLRSDGLESRPGDFSSIERVVGASRRGQVRGSRERQNSQLQLQISLPWFRRGERVCTGLEGQKQLGSPSLWPVGMGYTSNERTTGGRDCYRTKLGSAVVAGVDGDSQERHTYDPIGQERFYPRTVGPCGTLEERAMELFSGQSGATEINYTKWAEEVCRFKLALNTLKNYTSAWSWFEEFCNRRGWRALPASKGAVIAAMLDKLFAGAGSMAKKVFYAVRTAHSQAGLRSPTDDEFVASVRDSVEHCWRSFGGGRGPRDPFPVEAFRSFCVKPPDGFSQFEWERDKALLAVGLRLMRRPSELAELELRDISFLETGMVSVSFYKSKGQKFAFTLPMDESSPSLSCPVKNLRDYVKKWRRNMHPQTRLFTKDAEGRRVWNGADIDKELKRIASVLMLPGNIGGHSARSGGATAAAAGGATLTQIQAVGRWTSEAALLYIRGVAAAAGGLSAKMGL